MNLAVSSNEPESPLDTCKQFVASNRLFDKIDGAHLHRSNGHRNVGVSTHDNCGNRIAHRPKTLDQVNAAQSRQQRIDEKTALLIGMICFQKMRSAREGLHDISVVLEHVT